MVTLSDEEGGALESHLAVALVALQHFEREVLVLERRHGWSMTSTSEDLLHGAIEDVSELRARLSRSASA